MDRTSRAASRRILQQDRALGGARPADTDRIQVRSDAVARSDQPIARVSALKRSRPDGFTLIGADSLPDWDLNELEAALDRADRNAQPSPQAEGEAWRGEAEPLPCVPTTYQLVNEHTAEAVTPRRARVIQAATCDAGSLLDGGTLKLHVMQVRES